MAILQRSLLTFNRCWLQAQFAVPISNSYNNFKRYAQKSHADNMSKTALIILSPGAEEMEFTISADVLRRGGIKVTVGGLCGTEPVKCSRDVIIRPDESLESVKHNKYDVIVMPGGLGGSKAMADSKLVGEMLKQQQDENRIIAAICAAPIALAAHGIGLGKALTSYPSVKEQLVNQYVYNDNDVTVNRDNLITSRGPGTAFNFALTIVETLCGLDKAKDVAKAMLINYKC